MLPLAHLGTSGTAMCTPEKDAFLAHYKRLQQHYSDQVDKARQMGGLEDEQQQQQQQDER
jgi:hypothetical protein